jgi:hypothetical protein
MIILPLLIIKVINSDKIINGSRSYSYMNNPNTDNDNKTTGVLTFH